MDASSRFTFARRFGPRCFSAIPKTSQVQPDRDGAGMPLKALRPAEAYRRRTERPQALRCASEDRRPLHEVENPEARGEPGRTGGRQDVVGTADIVADRLRGVRPEEDRAGVAHLRGERLRILRLDLEVLG